MFVRNRSLWLVIALTGLLALASACGVNPQPLALTPVPTLSFSGGVPTLVPALQVPAVSLAGPSGPVDAALGAAVFFENCSQCHGVQAEGMIGPALRNNSFIQSSTDQAVIDVVSGGRGQMPAWLQSNGGALTPSQIASVVAYLRSLQNVAPLPSATPQPTETPEPANAPTPEPAQPSNPGGPGQAMTLTGNVDQGRLAFGAYCATCHGPQGVAGRANPDSDDGSVPGINPIDPTIANADAKVFATNIDVFIEHGSIPSGPAPELMMPAFGDGKLLTPQQIADIIAYVISLNQSK